ncbi:MAG: adenosylhomocysteinase [Candidatus Gracilibacteria bacterium]|nr:adenosylhomocysteinase [Candidatus Gracilibacteria bacterium]
MAKNYEVRDISLAKQGKLNLDWARAHMGALEEVKKRFQKEKPLKGYRIAMALHVTKETGILVETLIAGGAQVAITGCNPLSTQDDIAAALAENGVRVYAYKGENHKDYYRYLNKVLDFKPHVTIDDGCDLVNVIHTKRQNLIKDIIGGCEETTTGIIRLRAMEKDKALKYPVIAVNDNKTKHLMDNYYGTGQSALDGITRATNLLWAGKTVVVIGYGDCGKGVALRAQGMSADVIVCEVDHICALQAKMDGYEVMKMDEAAKLGDVFITVTGDKHVIDKQHYGKMKDGAILANAGHFDSEINVPALEKMASKKRIIRPLLAEYTVGKKVIYLAGEGRLVNLVCAEGHPSEVMSMSFCGQALACEYIIKNKGKLAASVHQLPVSVDQKIAKLQLDAMGIKIDKLTPEQIAYLSSWKEGT